MDTYMQRAAIAIDEWKLPIFERHLKQAGYAFDNCGHLTAGTLILKVHTENLEALEVVVRAAQTECNETRNATCPKRH